MSFHLVNLFIYSTSRKNKKGESRKRRYANLLVSVVTKPLISANRSHIDNISVFPKLQCAVTVSEAWEHLNEENGIVILVLRATWPS